VAHFWKLGSEDYIKCRESLKAPDYKGRLDELCLKRHENTCKWLPHDERYKAWADEDDRAILWISAGPGCGKSVLSSFLCKEILPNQLNQLPVAYFFCDDKDEQLRTARAILEVLLAQLLEQLPGLWVHFSDELKYKGEKLWDYNMLWRVFEGVMHDENTGCVCLLIDALGMYLLSPEIKSV
jgi:hypothetical protein